MSVRIVTDSTSDLPPEICRELDITVVPLTVNFDDMGYRDGVDLSADEFYKKLIESDKLPTTSQPSAGAFAEAYKDVAKDTDEILSIHISGKLSQTYNSARLAATEMEGSCNVQVMDSLQVSMGLGCIVMSAARAARDGASMEDLQQLVSKLMPETRTLALLETLEYLAKGGRIGKVQAYLGNSLRPLAIFKVIPIVEVRDGEAHPLARVRTRQKGLDRLLTEAQQCVRHHNGGSCLQHQPPGSRVRAGEAATSRELRQPRTLPIRPGSRHSPRARCAGLGIHDGLERSLTAQ